MYAHITMYIYMYIYLLASLPITHLQSDTVDPLEILCSLYFKSIGAKYSWTYVFNEVHIPFMSNFCTYTYIFIYIYINIFHTHLHRVTVDPLGILYSLYFKSIGAILVDPKATTGYNLIPSLITFPK
jgi:hypothetical protein